MTVVAFAVNYSTPLASFGGEPLKIVAAKHRAVESAWKVGSTVVHELIGNWKTYRTSLPK